MKKRLDGLGQVISGPAQVLLSSVGYADAHERVRQLTLKEGSLYEHLESDPEVAPYWAKLTERQKEALKTPSGLTQPAARQARATAKKWQEWMKSQREVQCV